MREDQTGIWTNLGSAINSIPEDSIAITVYILGSLIILWCWFGIAKRLPALLGAITWIVIFAVLLTPTISAGPNSAIAPAVFGLLFGVLTKDSPLIWSNLSLISFVIGLAMVVGYFWTKFKTSKALPAQNVKKKTSPL